ncbi:MAG: hypothetical protein PHS96_08825 [Anaerolineales bacterium]|nr:hypothetical protein [Anaerolineales bacterium]
MQTLVAYLPLFAMFCLLGVALGMLVVRGARPKFNLYWLLASAGALLAWVLIALSGALSPVTIPLATWRWENVFVGAPSLLVDRISFPFAFALVSLLLATLLSDAVRYSEESWSTWFLGLVLTTFALLAVLSGDSITLLWSWAALDVFDLALHLAFIKDPGARNRAIISFSLRSSGIMVYLLGTGAPLFQLLAVLLRLAALLISSSLYRGGGRRESLGVLLQFGTACANLVLIARIAVVGLPANSLAPLYLLTALAALAASLVWFAARQASTRSAAWVAGSAALCAAAAIRGQPLACVAWGVVMVLPGAVLALYTHRQRGLTWLPLLAALGASGLPYTPAWDIAWLHTPPYSILGVIYLSAQSLLLLGYLRHALSPAEPLPQGDRWVRLIYPLGLLILPITHLLIAAWGWRETAKAGAEAAQALSVQSLEAWSGALAIALFPLWLGFAWLSRRITRRKGGQLSLRPAADWWLKPIQLLYGALFGAFNFLTAVTEGEGGVMWTILLLALIFAFFVQGGVGR